MIFIITFIVFILVLSVLVLIHEAGHFFVAKKFGIKVEEFGFGLPPRAFGVKRGETVYSINWLPIGGFVKLYGEDEAGSGTIKIKDQKAKIKNAKDKDRAFFAKSVGQRALVVVAGIVMNSLLAFLIFYLFLSVSSFTATIPLLSDHKFFGVNQKNLNLNDTDLVVSVISPNSPAEKAGMKAPFRIISINQTNPKNISGAIDIINKNKGKKISIDWAEFTYKDGKIVNTKEHVSNVFPRANPPKNEGPMGIAFFPVAYLNYETTGQKIFSGITHPVNLMIYNFDILSKLVGVAVKEKNPGPVGETVSGPVGIFSIFQGVLQIKDIKERISEALNLVGLLSISLAFFNVLPFPGLDGGRLFFILIEAVSGKKVPARIEGYAHAVGMAILIGLIILVTYQDLMRFVFGPLLNK